MSHTIIYDRCGIKLKDGNYILMLQIGSSNTYEIRGSREVRLKSWSSLQLEGESGEDICCSLEKMKERIAYLAEDYKNIAKKSCSNFFKTEKSFITFLENGLKNPYSIEEYRAAGNGFQIHYWDKEKHDIIKRYVRSEEELKEKLKELSADPNYMCVGLTLDSRDMFPVVKNTVRKKSERPQHGYLISATDSSGAKTYFLRKTKKYLKLTVNKDFARVFGSETAAKKYMDGLPKVKDNFEFAIEEYGVPERKCAPSAEMGE